MKQKITGQLSYWMEVVALGIVLSLVIQGARAWTEPGDDPPLGNVESPVNTGSLWQTKQGPLTLFSDNWNDLIKAAFNPDFIGLLVAGKTQADDFCLNGDPTKCLSNSGGGEVISGGDNFHFTTVSSTGVTDFPVIPRSMWSSSFVSGKSTYLVDHYGGWGQSAERGAISVVDKSGNEIFRMSEMNAFSGTRAAKATVTDKNGNVITTFPGQAQEDHYVFVLFKNVLSPAKIRSDGAPANVSNPTSFKYMTVTKLGNGSVDFPVPTDMGSRDTFYTVSFNYHSASDCTAIGGESVSVDGLSVCKLNAGSCPSGWSQYDNWSATSPKTCTGTNTGGCTDGTSCTTGSHAFGYYAGGGGGGGGGHEAGPGPGGIESCTFTNATWTPNTYCQAAWGGEGFVPCGEGCSCCTDGDPRLCGYWADGSYCDVASQSCIANITQIGCY